MSNAQTLLTPREQQVFSLIGEGKGNKEIAADLKLSPWTVADHRKSLCRKLGVRSTAELIRLAVAEALRRETHTFPRAGLEMQTLRHPSEGTSSLHQHHRGIPPLSRGYLLAQWW